MKNRLMAPFLVAALGMACVADDSPLLLGNFRPFEAGSCSVSGDSKVVSTSGALDVAATTLYLKPIEITSQLQGGVANEFVVDRVWLDYTSNPDIGLADENYPLHFVLQPGSTGNFLVLEMFPGQADDTLKGQVVSGLDLSVVVGVRLSGRTRAGTAIESNRVQYPITVYNSGWLGCPAGSVEARSGPCGGVGGQDDYAPYCCPGTNTGCEPGTPLDGGV